MLAQLWRAIVETAEPSPSQASLREHAIESVRWVTLSRIGCELVSFLSVIALARLLTPSEVGYAAIAMIALALAAGLIGGSFGSPLIKQEKITEAHVEVAALLSLLSGLALALLCCLVALGVAQVLDGPYASMIALASPAFLLVSICTVPQALRSRRFAFKAIMLIDVVSALTGSVFAVILAALNLGSAALVLGSLITLAVAALLSPIGVGWVRPRWHPAIAGDMLRFGLPASASSLLFIAIRNIDYALISGRMSAAQVGLYYRAYTLAIDYQSKISIILVRVLFPVLSRATSAEMFRAARRRMVRAHTVALFPLLAILGITAPEVIPLVYGDQWSGAIVPTQILIIGGFTAAIGTGIGPMMLAAGNPKALLKNNVASFVCFTVTVYVCAGYGLIATCIGVAVYRVLALTISMYFLATRQLGIPLHETLLVDPLPAAVSAGALALAALPVTRLMASTPSALNVAVTATVGFAVYALVLRTVFSAAWFDLALVGGRFVPQRLRRRATANVPQPVRQEG